MKSPELYSIIKIDLDFLLEQNKSIFIKNTKENKKNFFINQQYNQLFRFIKKFTNKKGNTIEEVVFLECKNYKSKKEELKEILLDGFFINGTKYKFYGKSASMGRNAVLGFMSEDVFQRINQVAMMDLDINFKDTKVVLSKFEAYKHLLFSSCFCIEGKLPNIIVVDDYETTIKNVHINYVDETEKEYVDKDGNNKIFREKVIKEGYKDIELNTNDGAGLCSMEIAKKWAEILKIGYTPCVFMLRMPYVKGLVASFDFKNFYKERNIKIIKDIWGKEHLVDEIDIILTKSQFKGIKYFKKYGDYRDWEYYLELFYKYDHCLGIAKWNYSHEEEPKMTRANYQILQTLNLQTEDLIEMSKYTRDWIENIISGENLLYVLNYLGINQHSKNSDNKYMKAIALNNDMIHDIKVQSYLMGLLEKTINEIKIGKIYLKGAFKILIPDLVAMAEYIGGIEPKGCLNKGEMFAKEHDGRYVLNRNPHICSSEHVIATAVNNDLTNKWCGHLENVCMINNYDITAPRLNGADKDGDLVLVHKNDIFIKGIDPNLPITLDIEDKITAIENKYTLENLIDFTLVSMDSRIGEISNCASSYHNKNANSKDNKKKYNDYTCLLSVINGKEIDYAKTGVRWNVPFVISKYAKPLPYFLKYKYPHIKEVSNSKSAMNEHCWFIEKWQRNLKYNRIFKDTSYCMIDNKIPFNDEKYEIVKRIFDMYKREYKEIKLQEKMSRNYEMFKDFWLGMTKEEVENTKVNWDIIYDKYREILSDAIPNQCELANYIINLIYIENKGRHNTFAWEVATEGIISNLRTNRKEPLLLPKECNSGDEEAVEYLGKYYKLEEYNGEF